MTANAETEIRFPCLMFGIRGRGIKKYGMVIVHKIMIKNGIKNVYPRKSFFASTNYQDYLV